MGPITGPEAETGLCDTAVCWLLKERLFWLGKVPYIIVSPRYVNLLIEHLLMEFCAWTLGYVHPELKT